MSEGSGDDPAARSVQMLLPVGDSDYQNERNIYVRMLAVPADPRVSAAWLYSSIGIDGCAQVKRADVQMSAADA